MSSQIHSCVLALGEAVRLDFDSSVLAGAARYQLTKAQT